MRTRAVRLYGANDLRLEDFDLPAIKEDEILVKNITDSICMSTYKAAIQGTKHKRVPQDIDKNPIIVGHEFAGIIVEVGDKWKHQFKAGDKFAIQPALNYKGSLYSPGYSYPHFGGAATYTIIPNEVMELGCLLNYSGESYYEASLAEPMSCIIGAFHATYHTKPGCYDHLMGIKDNGKMAILAGAGAMGLGAVDYIIHCEKKPSMIVVTDIDEARLQRARTIFNEKIEEETGVVLRFVNTRNMENPTSYLLDLTENTGFDEVYVYAPVQEVVEQADRLLARDGCLNFFAGPVDPNFSASLNFYNVHYASTHVMGTTGGNTNDMLESLKMTEEGRINPAVMVTHIGGMNSVICATMSLPYDSGGKKLIYTCIDMELTALEDFEAKGKENIHYKRLAEIVKNNNGLWCLEAEKYLLENMQP